MFLQGWRAQENFALIFILRAPARLFLLRGRLRGRFCMENFAGTRASAQAVFFCGRPKALFLFNQGVKALAIQLQRQRWKKYFAPEREPKASLEMMHFQALDLLVFCLIFFKKKFCHTQFCYYPPKFCHPHLYPTPPYPLTSPTQKTHQWTGKISAVPARASKPSKFVREFEGPWNV